MENLKKSFLVRGNNIVGFSDKKNFSTAPLGTVLSFAGQARPNGYLLCDGASYKVTDYPDLYAVIGNTYGGDSTNFNVPNLVDASQSPASTMIYIIKAFHTNEGVDSDAGSGEENKIDSISVNGSPISIDENKNVDITVPDAYDDTALVKRVSDIESDYAKSSDIPSFDGYATEDYVAEQIDNIPSVDLTDYAKKNEIPDVSGYITEEQLLAKDYVDKAYVAEEITKVSDATNAENLKLSDGTIVNADTINTKLSKLDTTDNLSVELEKKIDKPVSATDGQVLTYNGTSNEWEAQDSKGGTTIRTSRTRRDITSDLVNLTTAIAEQDLAKYGYAIGDYFVGASGYYYYLADMDTNYSGYNSNAVVDTHHCGIVVDTKSTCQWLASGSVTNYSSSTLHLFLTNTALPKIKSDIATLFGDWESHLLERIERDNAIGGWSIIRGCLICAMTEAQMYGSSVFGADGDQTGPGYKALELFRKYRFNEIYGDTKVWLKSIFSENIACSAASAGYADYDSVSFSSRASGLILFH